jgi:hypothetical protein
LKEKCGTKSFLNIIQLRTIPISNPASRPFMFPFAHSQSYLKRRRRRRRSGCLLGPTHINCLKVGLNEGEGGRCEWMEMEGARASESLSWGPFSRPLTLAPKTMCKGIALTVKWMDLAADGRVKQQQIGKKACERGVGEATYHENTYIGG